jgi:signal transduction histidine kinase
MINTILRNLISNALKFTRQDGKVVVTAESKDGGLMVTVSDNGVGIPPHRVDKIFRYDGSFSTAGTNNEKGTGLGLMLCRDFVKRHGGKIWVESEEGKNTRFSFTIPGIH